MENMSYTHKIGIITLIPKGNKDRKYLRNWRPISVLNVLYKIASSCIANRMEKKRFQYKGFMSGRFIGENIRFLYDIMKYTDINDIPGLLLFFPVTGLFYFILGPQLSHGSNFFYEDAFSCVLVNGHLTNRFKIERGAVKATICHITFFFSVLKY